MGTKLCVARSDVQYVVRIHNAMLADIMIRHLLTRSYRLTWGCFLPCCLQLLENVTRHQPTEQLSDILPPIEGVLCDSDPAVREAALARGAAFGVLFKGGAHGAVESVVPSLLNGLDKPAHASQSLEGLRVILSVRPQVFNGIVPKLLKHPVSSAGLRAIGQLAATAGKPRWCLAYVANST